MSRYVIQFYKEGSMRYISHLDLLRLFKRTFKRTGIRLIYSQGFNPHPKMSFVQPLSLGYSSEKEYLDFETIEELSCDDVMSGLNGAMPKGVGVTACRRLPQSKRTLAAVVEYASYEIQMELSEPVAWKERIADFLAQDEILTEKKQKKTGKLVQQDIRSMILTLNPLKGDDNNISLTALICAGSNRNLNPEVMLAAFCGFCAISVRPETVSVKRKELYVQVGDGELKSIIDYE